MLNKSNLGGNKDIVIVGNNPNPLMKNKETKPNKETKVNRFSNVSLSPRIPRKDENVSNKRSSNNQNQFAKGNSPDHSFLNNNNNLNKISNNNLNNYLTDTDKNDRCDANVYPNYELKKKASNMLSPEQKYKNMESPQSRKLDSTPTKQLKNEFTFKHIESAPIKMQNKNQNQNSKYSLGADFNYLLRKNSDAVPSESPVKNINTNNYEIKDKFNNNNYVFHTLNKPVNQGSPVSNLGSLLGNSLGARPSLPNNKDDKITTNMLTNKVPSPYKQSKFRDSTPTQQPSK